ncbi:MAG: class I SAM-dependent methyltransferase [Anaerolineae bacterium]|jgi:ubiquinone/menaquinone biosynthesis C-methylase UbiE|nr:class I SAM-dependent methyltransferase [Anaerolineae bacterium]
MHSSENKDLYTWPFVERRFPSIDNPDYLGMRSISLGLQKAISIALNGKKDLNILDVGCGHKPFYPFLKPYSKEYIGTDIIKDNPLIDIVCPAENLLIDDQWADLSICLSVLEHVDDPNQVVKELNRVTKPDGIVFASTHGCFPWHPYPQDHWRWTQTGLPLLFTRQGGFSEVEIFATHGTFSGMAFVLAHFFNTWTTRRGKLRSALNKPLVRFINRFGQFIDSKTPQMSDINRHVTAIPEFFVIARK